MNSITHSQKKPITCCYIHWYSSCNLR